MLGFDPLDKMPLRDAFVFAAENSFALEIQLEPPLFWFSEEQIQQLRGLRSEYPEVPLIIHAPYRDVFLGSLYDVIRRAGVELVKKSIDLSADLDAVLVVFHAGEVNSKAPRDLAVERARESIGEIFDHAKDRGVPVALENAPFWKQSLFLYASDFLPLENVPICLDVPHAYAVDALDAFFDLLGDRIAAYHLSDTVRGRDHHAPLGGGEIPWRSVLSRLDPEKPWILEVGDRESVLKSIQLIRSLGFG